MKRNVETLVTPGPKSVYVDVEVPHGPSTVGVKTPSGPRLVVFITLPLSPSL